VSKFIKVNLSFSEHILINFSNVTYVGHPEPTPSNLREDITDDYRFFIAFPNVYKRVYGDKEFVEKEHKDLIEKLQ